MSNILTPIVARYSLFFTLAMFSSSSISRSKQPTHLVQTLLIEAQQRYQDKSTEKLRALIRHLSTTSTSSSSLSQSAVSSSQLTSSSGAGSTEISSPSSSSYIQPAATAAARIEPPSSYLEMDMPSLPPLLEQQWQEGSFLAAAHNNNNNNNQSSEHRIHDSKSKGATTTFEFALDQTEQEGNLHPNHNYNHSSNHNERSRSSSPPGSTPLIGDDDDATVMATAASAVAAANAAATVSSDRPNLHKQQHTSTLPSPFSSYSLSFSSPSSAAQHGQRARQQQQSGSNNNHNSNKVNKSSIAALLSVTLTMILLSLLQSKKRHIRRKSRSPRGTTSKRHSRRGSRQLLLAQQHREGYKSTGTDHLTPRSHSPSSSSYTNNNNNNNSNNNSNSSSSNNVNFFLTDHNNNNSNINMEGTSSVTPEGKRSSLLLTQYRPTSFFGGGHGGEPTSAAYHNHHHSLPLPTHGHHILSDPHNNGSLPNLLPSSPSSNPSYPPYISHFDPTTRLLHQGNMYSGREIGYSLSDTNLPDKRSKRDLVTDWLDQQTIVAPSDMVEAPEHLTLVQDGPNSNIANDNEPLHQFHHHRNAHHHHQQQQQQQILHQRQSFPAQLDPNQLYHQQSINNTGAQRELRQQQQGQQGQGQEHYPRVIQRTNELYQGSRSSLYRSPSASRHSMVALDQQEQQQQSSSPSFWRESQLHLQSQQQQQFSPHQYRPQYQQYPQQQQQHLPHLQQPHPAHYGHYQQQYAQTAASPPTYRPPYEPLGYEDQDQQDANHRRSLSLNNSGGRRVGARSRPQSQVYRKATPARFENLSLAEQARQEHQMRRQHYQQHYHQHRQQQQQQPQHQHQHQQYYHASGSRPQSMYSNGYGAAASPRAPTSPREVNQFVPPRHHQAHPRPHLPPIVMHQHQQQHRHPSDLRHSIVSSPKTSNVSRSANDLAWERHCYYQQQQIQEDALAERKLIEQQQHAQQQKRPQRPLSSIEDGLQVPLLQGSSSSVVRAFSMSRVSSISTTAITDGNATSTIGRRTAIGKTALGSSGLSRSVSTSAITDSKARAAKKDKSSHPNLKKNGKESLTTETETKSSAMDCKFLRLFRSDSKLSAKKMVSANTESPSTSTQAQVASSKEQSTVPVIVTIQPLDSTTPAPSPAAATTGLNRRRTLKDLAPSIRSLARRCSSRFSSNNSSSRPNSFAGSGSDPMIQFAEGKALGDGNNSFLLTTSYLPLKLSLTSLPRSLAPGPDGIVDLQQAASPSPSSLSVKYFPPASASTPSLSLSDMLPSPPQKEQQEMRVPIHRKVTLFRSKTLSLAKSSLRLTSPPPTSHADDTIDTTPSNGMTAADDHDDDYNNNNRNSSTRANSLPSRRRRQRDSLRLANGHGLDFDTFLPPTTTASNVTTSTSAENEASVVEKSTNDLESALPGAGLGRSTTPPVLPAIVTTGARLVDMEQQQKARRQIISLLAMGRKDRISAKTGHSMKSGSSTASSPTTPTTASTLATTLSQLSPLALEAQEDLFVTPAAAEEKKGGEVDPCEKIAFMLVPKSRYEFQPLVVA